MDWFVAFTHNCTTPVLFAPAALSKEARPARVAHVLLGVGIGNTAGAMEVGMVLQELLKVEYKVIFVSSGAELASKGRDLSEHFATQGTPIMMGGGVLACVHLAPLIAILH